MTQPASQIVEQLRQNLQEIQADIAAACARAGRERDSVQLIAVTKYAEWEWVLGLMELGERHPGESRPQQLVQRAELAAPTVHWHLIGQLQRNKVRAVLPSVSLIHSVESLRLLERIDFIAADLGLTPRLLLQVNVSGEARKQGFSPNEVLQQVTELQRFEHVHIDGLMTMAPHSDSPDVVRKTFRDLRELRDRLRLEWTAKNSNEALPHLSMGMSEDFPIAIEEGATLIRVGSRLYRGL